MSKEIIPVALLALLSMPAFGQTMYKCPNPSGVVKFQQTPCPNGQSVTVNIAPTGAGGLRDSERSYLQDRQQQAASKPTATTGASETSPECFSMRRRILEMENREKRGIHTWSKSGEEESVYRKREYTSLCGPW